MFNQTSMKMKKHFFKQMCSVSSFISFVFSIFNISDTSVLFVMEQ